MASGRRGTGCSANWPACPRNSRHLISDSPQHYLNEGDPDLIVAAVTDVIRCARDGVRLETGEGGLVLEPRDRSE